MGSSRSSDRALDERGDERRVDEVHRGVGARQEVVGDEARQRQDVGEVGPVAEALERGRDGHAGAAHRGVALAADGHDLEVAAGAR